MTLGMERGKRRTDRLGLALLIHFGIASVRYIRRPRCGPLVIWIEDSDRRCCHYQHYQPRNKPRVELPSAI